jgi:threonine/homoserine/homoserine lactone efflux protein
MPDSHSLALFAGAAIAILLIPGPAVLYIVSQSAEHGRGAGLVSVAGVHLGTLVHVAAATVGLSAIIVSSAIAFSVVKYAGAAYLIYVGIRRLLTREPSELLAPRDAPLKGLFTQGVVVNVLNPKTALFFLAFLPQFVDPDRGAVGLQAAVLGTLFVLLAVISDCTYALVASALAERLGRSEQARRLRRLVSGGIFVALGATAATAKRAA